MSSSSRKPKYGLPSRSAATGAQVPRTVVEWSPEDIRAALEGYDELDAEQWPSVPVGGQVRYFIKEGGLFRSGGIVVENPKQCRNSHSGQTEETMILSDAQTRSKQWPVYYSTIERLFFKPDPAVKMIREVVDAQSNNNTKMVEAIKDLRARVAALEAAVLKGRG